uniref:Uncharacterized protein n=1 Tax=Moniliophthora roreri TaxID=221103 RepID=A0A0W0FWJ2_MONRR
MFSEKVLTSGASTDTPSIPIKGHQSCSVTFSTSNDSLSVGNPNDTLENELSTFRYIEKSLTVNRNAEYRGQEDSLCTSEAAKLLLSAAEGSKDGKDSDYNDLAFISKGEAEDTGNEDNEEFQSKEEEDLLDDDEETPEIVDNDELPITYYKEQLQNICMFYLKVSSPQSPQFYLTEPT